MTTVFCEYSSTITYSRRIQGNQIKQEIKNTEEKGWSFLGESDSHWILWGDFETLKGLHGHGWLHIIFKFYKGNAWLCFNHSNFLKSWILLEEHFKHWAGGFVGQILYEQYIIWSSSFLCICISKRGLHIIHKIYRKQNMSSNILKYKTYPRQNMSSNILKHMDICFSQTEVLKAWLTDLIQDTASEFLLSTNSHPKSKTSTGHCRPIEMIYNHLLRKSLS